MPITVFASTIDDKIQPFLNKPYDIKNITTQLTPFFEALNFFATKSNKITQTPIVSSTEKPADQVTEQSAEPSTEQVTDASDTSTPVAENVSALPTLFQETTDSSSSSPSPEPASPSAPAPTPPSSPAPDTTPTPPTPTPTPNPTTPSTQQSLLGDYLRKLLEGLEKADLPEGTSIYFSRDFQDETYDINLKIKTPNGVERNLTVELDNVNEENKLYKSFSDTVKTHIFLDWKTNVETEEQSLEDGQKQQVVKSISAINNPNFRFKANEAPSKISKEKVHVDEQEQGIYLAEGGISLENDPNTDKDLKLENGTSFLYAFKPSKLPQTDALQYFLLKTGEQENDFNLIIEKELFVPGVFKIGADFVAKPKTRPQRQPFFPSFNPKKEGFKTTYNGEYDIQLKLSNGEASLSLGNTKPKNPLSFLQDFLNNSESTIILRVDIEKKDSKSVMNMKFYSSESDDAKKPIFT